MSSWTQSSISLDKLCEIQKPANDRTGLGFNTGESNSGETCTQSNLAHDKFKNMRFVKATVIHDPCESVRYDDQISELLNKKGKAGIGYDRPESSKSGWLKNRLDKEQEKAGSKWFVQNQQRRGSKKVKSEWKKLSKKMMNSRRICPADGSQYKQSAVGLVFMESAAGLAMETSKVESAVRNQAEAKLNKLEYSKPAGTMTTSCKR
ncbi:hypothetical protein F511_42795 [Dorcoceras hygrometricum]|uniref:Uncharacterized protein n=1 Tax=Dorcoceras hygrometricum TaxID=472368 RepID=A0A2Z7A6D9_9LAMI|nr:hypothetical protein F511_42795 [Dorcoceras hygrometricum]